MIRPTSNSDGVCLPRSAVGLRDSRLSRVWKRSDVLCDRSSNSFRKRANCVCVIEYDTFSHRPPHSLASFFVCRCCGCSSRLCYYWWFSARGVATQSVACLTEPTLSALLICPTVGDSAFPLATARVWNEQKRQFTSTTSAGVFCRRLKTHF